MDSMDTNLTLNVEHLNHDSSNEKNEGTSVKTGNDGHPMGKGDNGDIPSGQHMQLKIL